MSYKINNYDLSIDEYINSEYRKYILIVPEKTPNIYPSPLNKRLKRIKQEKIK